MIRTTFYYRQGQPPFNVPFAQLFLNKATTLRSAEREFPTEPVALPFPRWG